MKGKKTAKSECVKVAIRVRPMNKHEKEQKSTLCVDVDTANNTVAVNSTKGETKTFQFDYVYPMDTTQRDIYDQVAFPIVDSIFQGYNGTIFAYGQSGSGKTYTMYGNDLYDENIKGIIPRVVEEIFKRVEKSDRNIDFQLKLSVMEIYKEVVYDLFTNENNLKIIENKEKGVYIENLSEVYLCSIEEFFNYIELSQKNRKVSETKLNHNSSRSHCIMILEVIQNYKKRNIKFG